MLKVRLELFMEQGSEGAHWSVYDETKTGYDGLISLSNGDRLIIPSVNFDQVINKDKESGKEWYYWCRPYIKKEDYRGLLESRHWVTKEMSDEECKQDCFNSFRQQVAGGYFCHWIQKDVNPNLWAQWFRDELDAFYISKES